MLFPFMHSRHTKLNQINVWFYFFYFVIYLKNTYTYSVDCIISIHNSGEKAVGSWGDIQQWGGSGEWK